MEEQLAKYFEKARSQGLTETDLIPLLSSQNTIKSAKSDYIKARSSGLTISQSEFASILTQEISKRGLDSVLNLLENQMYQENQLNKKRHRKVCKDEPKLTKKRKNYK